MSKRKKKPGKQFKAKWTDTGSHATRRKAGRDRYHMGYKEENVVIPYKSFFFNNDQGDPQ